MLSLDGPNKGIVVEYRLVVALCEEYCNDGDDHHHHHRCLPRFVGLGRFDKQLECVCESHFKKTWFVVVI